MNEPIPRARWGSTETDPAGTPVGRVGLLVVHHTWRPHVPADATAAQERQAMRAIQRYHVRQQGWDDIGYQFVVFQSGRIYEGRGWGRSGAHTVGHNDDSVAFCFAIDGDTHPASEAAWQAATDLAWDGVDTGRLTDPFDVAGHRDFQNKSCPGRRVYPHIGRLRQRRGDILPMDVLLYARRGTPDGLSALAACQALPDGVAVTFDPAVARAAVRGGRAVYTVGGPARDDVDGATHIVGVDAADTLVKTVAEAQAGWR